MNWLYPPKGKTYLECEIAAGIGEGCEFPKLVALKFFMCPSGIPPPNVLLYIELACASFRVAWRISKGVVEG
ncbi:MAG: hypothetical protein QXG48_04820 [Thermofilaceae archaeon]